MRGAVSVSDFFAPESGTLTWSVDDTDAKVISIEASNDNIDEGVETMFIRLENASDNAELGLPNIAKIDIQSLSGLASSIVLDDDNVTVKETDGTLSLSVTRLGGSDQVATVGLRIENDSAEDGADVTLSANSLVWAAGELGVKNIDIVIVNDDLSEGSESFVVILDNPQNVAISGSQSVSVTIRDDESNLAPAINTETSLNVNTRQSVTLTASASDPEGESMTFAWEQTSGPTVNLSNADSLSAGFTAPNAAGALDFTFTATDDFGVSTSMSVTVTVAAAPVSAPPSNLNSGGGGAILLMNILVLLTLLRRLAGPAVN
jgi:uncharacterized protein (UPF0333 family)